MGGLVATKRGSHLVTAYYLLLTTYVLLLTTKRVSLVAWSE